MKISRILALLLVAMLVGGMLAGCGGTNENNDPSTGNNVNNENNDTPKEPAKLRFATSSDIPGLNSTLATDQVSFEVLGNTVEGLYRLVGGNQVKEGLVEKVEKSADGLHYTFKIREDSKWTNGETVTAHDFIYAWKKLGDPENGSQYSFMLETAAFVNASEVITGDKPVEELGVKATDDFTIEVELSNPVPFFESLMTFPSFYPVNEAYAEGLGEDYGTTIDNMIFNGPFKLTKWETEYEYILTKNPDYIRADEVNIDEVSFRIVKDNNTAVNMYEAGEIDRVGLSGENIDIYVDSPELIDVPGTAVFYLEMNQDRPIFANIKVRKAFALGFDKSFITDEILKNGSKTADFLVPYSLANGPDGKDFRESTELFNAMNKAEASRLWEEAKVELGMDTIELEFLTYDSETSKKVSEYIQAQLESTLEGLTLTINQQPFNNKLALADAGNFDFDYAGWGPDYADPMTFLDMWITESGHNVMGYSSEEYDQLIYDAKQGKLTTDPEARWEALIKAEKILLEEDCALVPLFQRGGKSLIRPYVKNMQLNSFAPDYYYANIRVEK